MSIKTIPLFFISLMLFAGCVNYKNIQFDNFTVRNNDTIQQNLLHRPIFVQRGAEVFSADSLTIYGQTLEFYNLHQVEAVGVIKPFENKSKREIKSIKNIPIIHVKENQVSASLEKHIFKTETVSPLDISDIEQLSVVKVDIKKSIMSSVGLIVLIIVGAMFLAIMLVYLIAYAIGQASSQASSQSSDGSNSGQSGSGSDSDSGDSGSGGSSGGGGGGGNGGGGSGSESGSGSRVSLNPFLKLIGKSGAIH